MADSSLANKPESLGLPIAKSYDSWLGVYTDDPTCQGQSPCYQKIQAAIDEVQAGDTVRVHAGTYE